MKYLLDTHTFVWLNGDAAKLSSTAKSICADRDNTLLFSLASVWEMQIKLQIGKMRLPADLAEILERQQAENGVELLAIRLLHILGLVRLPNVHRDPFDRILVAQAVAENAILISNDPYMKQYPVNVAW